MKQKKLIILIAGVFVLLLAVIGILTWKYQQVSKVDENKKTSARILDKVGDLYLLPSNEEPTVALIQDKTKLSNQDFFTKAKNGDYLLIYQKDKLALIYREQDDKLVNVGPVNIDGQNNQGETAGAQTSNP